MQDPNLSQVSLRFFNVVPYGTQLFPDCNLARMIQRGFKALDAKRKSAVRVKHFQAIHHSGVNIARGLSLLFGLGTKALPSWDSKTRWNNLSGGLAVG